MSPEYEAAVEIHEAIHGLTRTIRQQNKEPEPQTLWTSWKCPECEHLNRVRINPFAFDLFGIRYCNTEEGGCDSSFAVKFTIETTAEVFQIVKK